ncbi:hypothetical protein PY093_03490 [Cytobacillus sp. S13-E01]|uniref:hypothetical protein n=1 Tax=Cytobacillus sp. S13-E01 TaxID=3031326 RepID=UPI0023D82BF4|nr:hypothetical protein [Cytobacillus sp. S13-E01]MDF0725776.1 hypothetical protein [Cytobacillus sp. S13-E01]
MRFNHFSRDQKTNESLKLLEDVSHSKPVILFEYFIVAIVLTSFFLNTITSIIYVPLLFISFYLFLLLIHVLVYCIGKYV